jgi:pimeloyl-ACP methyl ester carboxylesterase
MEEGMSTAGCETGLLLEQFPYIRIGNGPRNLLVIPGSQVDNTDPGFVVRQTYRVAFAPFAREHTLYIVNRLRNLPATYTYADMAADYVRVLHEIGPARVLGLSAGGMIAQHVALQAPELVEKLALVVAAARLSEEGRRIGELLIALAEAGRWADVEAELASGLFTRRTSQRLIRGIVRAAGKLFVSPPQYGQDFVTTMRAALDFDSRPLLPRLRVPTLVLGGSVDLYFPRPLLQEIADLIPDATLRIYEGAGHGLVKMQKRRFEDDVLAFLARSPVASAA